MLSRKRSADSVNIANALHSREHGRGGDIKALRLSLPQCKPRWKCTQTFYPSNPERQRCPIFALGFCPTVSNSHLLCVADEDGYLAVIDSKEADSCTMYCSPHLFFNCCYV